LLGIALVDIPRELWRSSHIDYELRKVYFKLSKLYTEMLESEEDLENVLEVLISYIILFYIKYFYKIKNKLKFGILIH